MSEKCPINLAYSCDFHGNCRVLIHAANLRHGTDGVTSTGTSVRPVRECVRARGVGLNSASF
jgi:hypothetical protein